MGIALRKNRKYQKLKNVNIMDLKVGDRFYWNSRTFQVTSEPRATSRRKAEVTVRTTIPNAETLSNYEKVRDDYVSYIRTSLDAQIARGVMNPTSSPYYTEALQNTISHCFGYGLKEDVTWRFLQRTNLPRVVYRPDIPELDPVLEFTHLIREAAELKLKMVKA